MSRRRADDDDWDDESDDAEDAGEGDDDSDGEPTVPCPHCHREILEDAPWCPSCGSFVTEEDLRRAARPMWVVVTALVCLAIALWWAFASF